MGDRTGAPPHDDMGKAPAVGTESVRKERAMMGKKSDDDWDPNENRDQLTDPDTGVSQNGNVHTSMADDEEREGK
ncbi:hypothetical protein [Streptomyces syringium]|uniref:hypothetical protein n=1 Tax=Streptomyces syringium TaxID=76729 RepID=UPI0034471F05